MADRASPNIAMVSFMAGLAGAGLALLLAPRSGKETREHMKARSEELKGQAEDSIHKAKDNITTSFDKTRESLADTINKSSRKAKEQYDEFRDSSEERTGARQSPVLRAWEEEV